MTQLQNIQARTRKYLALKDQYKDVKDFNSFYENTLLYLLFYNYRPSISAAYQLKTLPLVRLWFRYLLQPIRKRNAGVNIQYHTIQIHIL